MITAPPPNFPQINPIIAVAPISLYIVPDNLKVMASFQVGSQVTSVTYKLETIDAIFTLLGAVGGFTALTILAISTALKPY